MNTLSANFIETPPDEDPRMVFLKTLIHQLGCAAHIGSLALTDHVDSTRELFAAGVAAGECM